MVTDSVWIKIDGARVTAGCEDALAKLDGSAGELVLDLSEVRRLDPAGLRALEQLAGKAVKVSLAGVHVDVYKVLKLVRLAPRFTYLG